MRLLNVSEMLTASIVLLAIAETEVNLLTDIVETLLEEKLRLLKPVSGFFNCKKHDDFSAIAIITNFLLNSTQELYTGYVHR